MPKKETPQQLLEKHLGKEASAELIKTIDKMIAEGAPTASIQKATDNYVATHIEKQLFEAIEIKIGPQPVKIKPLQVAIKPAIKPTPVVRINTGISVRISPPVYTKGTR